MGSDLVLSVCHPCAGQYEMLWVTSRYTITPKMLIKSVKVTDFVSILGVIVYLLVTQSTL